MAIKTDVELTAEANIIGNETVAGANTADRVRDMLINIIDSKSQTQFRGDYAGTTTMPTTGGTFTGGVPGAGNRWRLTNILTIDGNVYAAGTIIEATINTPGQTLTNWIFYATQL